MKRRYIYKGDESIFLQEKHTVFPLICILLKKCYRTRIPLARNLTDSGRRNWSFHQLLKRVGKASFLIANSGTIITRLVYKHAWQIKIERERRNRRWGVIKWWRRFQRIVFEVARNHDSILYGLKCILMKKPDEKSLETVPSGSGRVPLSSDIVPLKEQYHKIISFRFFSWIIFPKPLKITLGSFRIFLKIREDISQVKVHHQYQQHNITDCISILYILNNSIDNI